METNDVTQPAKQSQRPDASAPARGEPDLLPELPPGDHPLEVAARNGIGPLSAAGQKVWHGEASPCVSCGQLVRRNSVRCDACGQDLSEEMIAKMRSHAGPWYVLEHLHPFPGVSLDRILLQIRRGLITSTSIVRGPATDYQWRFAVETPGLCRCFGRCWNCYHGVVGTDAYCPACLSHLSFEKAPPKPAALATEPNNATATSQPLQRHAVSPTARPQQAPVAPSRTATELDQLASAARNAHVDFDDESHRAGRTGAGWIAAVAVAFVITALVWVTTIREKQTNNPSPLTTAPKTVTSQ